MAEFIRRVYERGKVTIPKELRDLYELDDGDFVHLRIVKVSKKGLKGARPAGEEVEE